MFNKGDSYKYSHYKLYPKDMVGSHSYFEARSDKHYYKLVFCGLQYYVLKHLAMNESAQALLETHINANAHGIPFNLEGFEKLRQMGYLPLRIIAKPEGSICDIREPLMTVESTDTEFAWLPSFVETLLSKLWYPCSVATKAYHMRKTLEGYLPGNSDNTEWVNFAYHNFGDRGSSSVESAQIGGFAHGIFFKGTDNFDTFNLLKRYYRNTNDNYELYSIPATEHSVMTAGGPEGEQDTIMNFLQTYSNTHKLIACVLDSYDLYKALNYVTNHRYKMRGFLETSGAQLVLRPDSGDPIQVLEQMLRIMLTNGVNYDLNNYGLKVFKHYRIIWGDGITPETINEILHFMVDGGFAPDNISFGSGGDLMQNCTRDTLGFAYKLSAVDLAKGGQTIDGWTPVCKDPITDPGKKSKAGLQTVKDGVVYYEDGKTPNLVTFADVRKNAGVL